VTKPVERRDSITVIIPVPNESRTLQPLFDRLHPVLTTLSTDWSVIVVDDGSSDATYETLCGLRAFESRVRILKLSRNFGKEAALTAGLEAATGARVVLMDGDLQHPPEALLDMAAIADTGIDVVFGIPRVRHGESRTRNLLSVAFYKLFSQTAEIRLELNASDFRMMSHRVVSALNALPEKTRFMKGLYAWVGFSQRGINYDVEPRRAGRSKWSFLKLCSYAWTGIISFSAAPLRLWSVIGTVIALGALCYAIWISLSTILFGRDVPGYATLAVAIFFLGGLQLLSIGVLGEYIARIFNESKNRPLYIIEAEHGFEE